MRRSLLVLPLLICSPVAFAYTAFGSHEAELTFDHWVKLPDSSHSMKAATDAINDQVQYMYGPMSLGKVLAAPKSDKDVIVDGSIKIEQQDDGTYIARYSYDGTIVIKDTSVPLFKLPLPNDPKTFFKTAQDNSHGKENPCTDPDYQDEGDFWYFWSVARPGCEGSVLKEGRDYNFVGHAKVRVLPNVTSSFPDYESLPDQDGHIQITLIMGKDNPSHIKAPRRHKGIPDDINAQNFRKVENELRTMGKESDVEFSVSEWTNAQVRTIVKEDLNPLPYVEEFNFRYKGDRARDLTVRMVFTTIDIDHQSNRFHYFLQDATSHSAVMIYDGHSGLGGNIDLQAIREAVQTKIQFRLPKTRYQIFFFNSCTSYAYYNDMFFAKKIIPGSHDKKGSKYLDVMTTGLETAFDGSVETDMAVIQAVNNWAETGNRVSYQELAKKMESKNLFGINGDEDNPTK